MDSETIDKGSELRPARPTSASGIEKFYHNMIKLTTLVLMAASLQSCIPYMVMNSMDHQHYSEYITQTEQINYERQKAGLQPVPIMTFKEWKGGSAVP